VRDAETLKAVKSSKQSAPAITRESLTTVGAFLNRMKKTIELDYVVCGDSHGHTINRRLHDYASLAKQAYSYDVNSVFLSQRPMRPAKERPKNMRTAGVYVRRSPNAWKRAATNVLCVGERAS